MHFMILIIPKFASHLWLFLLPHSTVSSWNGEHPLPLPHLSSHLIHETKKERLFQLLLSSRIWLVLTTSYLLPTVLFSEI